MTAFVFVSANTGESADDFGDADESVTAFAFASGDSPELSDFRLRSGVFLFHAFKISEMREKSSYFLTIFFSHTRASTRWNFTS